ncbi:hypothetical protein [Hymenobacter psychrophilus]|uniref:Uncharacterized protein n=1 Tax=Hymenobacter psychrophilus TaxID=651662 RepID=A0A1H3JM67_9BACT|nr:hypothetical protein [Hymenobacter psychrophilus]SDY40987.1 hypothetical protein SAMN04488069_108141 [Hymenobacter psychrophilus]
MTLSRRAASLFTGLLLLAAGSHAQTAPGQPTLDEQKVQVWCAAVRYVYDDNGRGNLKDKLNCGGSLKAFENSIKADSQKVYSLLYQPLEGRGTMYKGLGSNESRLQKLTSEIVARLKSSAARRGDPARMERLTTLETALNSYVNSGTPIGNLAGAEPAAENAGTTTDLDETTAAAPADAGPAEAGLDAAAPTASGVGESVMGKLFAPLALILGLLALVLFWLLNRKVSALADRVGRHRADIDAVKLGGGAGSGSADHLTPAQRREVEKLVTQRVAEAVGQNRNKPAGTAAATPARPEAAAPAARPVPAAAPETRVAEAPVSLSEVSAPPMATPAGSPAAAPRDEFESLVPPVQLPQPIAAPAPPVEPAGPAQYTRYVKVPVNGAFSEYDLSDEPQHDSIYEIHFDPQWPELATFNVTPNPAIHAYAIQSAQYSLREACRYQQPSSPVTRIVTEEEGVLRKVAGSWQIEQKAAIRFE